MPDSVRTVISRTFRDEGISESSRAVPEEIATAMTYNGGTQAVMMATPHDLVDFAIGFSLSEGIVRQAAEIGEVAVVPAEGGVELRMWLDDANAARLRQRRRHVAGPTGCGLCGVDSIAAALRPAARVTGALRVSPAQIMTAIAAVPALQALNIATRAVHGAAFWTAAQGIVSLREDVGRHNALDKLGGALARGAVAAADGIVLLTSRVSVEMVQKTAAFGVPVLVAVSAPTALAVRVAEAAGITLVGVARADGFEVFSHPHRIVQSGAGGSAHVA